MKLNKTETMWVVVNGRGEINHDTLSYYKKLSIKAFIEYAGEYPWEYWEKEFGFQCLKVLVTINRKEEVK